MPAVARGGSTPLAGDASLGRSAGEAGSRIGYLIPYLHIWKGSGGAVWIRASEVSVEEGGSPLHLVEHTSSVE